MLPLKSMRGRLRLKRMVSAHIRKKRGLEAWWLGRRWPRAQGWRSHGTRALIPSWPRGGLARFVGMLGLVCWAFAFASSAVRAQSEPAAGQPRKAPAETTPETQVLKAGLVGPKESPWWQVFSALDRTLRHQSKGEVALEPSALGLEVNEANLVAEAKFDILALTSTGACALDNQLCPRPGVKSAAKVLASPELAQRLAKQGWMLMGGGVAGSVHLFSTEAARAEKPATQASAWVMRGEEPLYLPFFKKRGASVVVAPLAEAPVLFKKRSPLIFASTPLAVVYFQWHPALKGYSDAPIGDFLAVTVLRQAAWTSLSAEGQTSLKEGFAKAHRILLNMLRKKSTESLNVLSSLGLEPGSL